MITAHFVDGPLQNKTHQVENPSWHLRYLIPKPFDFAASLTSEISLPELETVIYRRVEELSSEVDDYTYVYEGETQ